MSLSQDVLLRQLQQLKELRDSGALTQEGFERRAAELLANSDPPPHPPLQADDPAKGSANWSASPRAPEPGSRWEATPAQETSRPPSTGAVSVQARPRHEAGSAPSSAPASPESEVVAQGKGKALERPVAASASAWSAAPQARAIPDEKSAPSSERRPLSRRRSEEGPAVRKTEPSPSKAEVPEEPALAVGANRDAEVSDARRVVAPAEAVPVLRVETKQRRERWLRGLKHALPVDNIRAAVAVMRQDDGNYRQISAGQDDPVDAAAPVATVAAAPESEQQEEMERAAMAVPEAVPAAGSRATDTAGEAKERQSWWRRGPIKGASTIEEKRAPGAPEAEFGRGSAGGPSGMPEATAGGLPASETEVAVVEQPFQRDLRWRRQSFLPAKWDEVRQSEREESFWNRSSRVVPEAPDEDRDEAQGGKTKSTYWSRSRDRR